MVKRILIVAMIFSFLGLFNCDPIEMGQTVVPQATPIPTGSEFCAAAEANLQKLACIPLSAPYTKLGKSFAQFCKETLQNGIAINPQCLSTITSCSQANSCTNTTQQ